MERILRQRIRTQCREEIMKSVERRGEGNDSTKKMRRTIHVEELYLCMIAGVM